MKKLQINITAVLVLACIVMFTVSAYKTPKTEEIKVIEVQTKYVKVNSDNEFTEDKLYTFIESLNIRFPHIVMAQAVIETGSFTSKMFKAHNNLFGMKCPKSRPTTNVGKGGSYAKFENWKQSVIDYALFQAAYMSKIRTEADYFSYISRNYAQDSTYIEKVKKIANRYK
jgi:uncharacterized FlgJ-related protein